MGVDAYDYGMKSMIDIFVPHPTVCWRKNLCHFYFKMTKYVEIKGIEMLCYFSLLCLNPRSNLSALL